MFISDDHGIDFVGCYGNPDVRTPNIDALAKEGTMFTRMFAASPTCAPSRSALYTGLYPARNGCMGNHTTCRSDITALPTYLSRLGYRVVLAHKAHTIPKEVFSFEHIPAQLPKNPANRRTYRMEGLDTKAIDSLLAEHVKTKPDTPLCLIVADSSPHVVWERNKDFDPAKLKLPPWFVDTDLTRKALANYYQDIATMDKRVGEVRAALKRHGFEENTLFIYTTDQGSEWPHSKWTLYDAGLHVPFLAVWPGVTKPGTHCDALISFVDVTPTFIDIAGGEQPQGLDGKSFLPVLTGKEKSFRDYHLRKPHPRRRHEHLPPAMRPGHAIQVHPEPDPRDHLDHALDESPRHPREPQRGLGHLGRKGQNRPPRRQDRPPQRASPSGGTIRHPVRPPRANQPRRQTRHAADPPQNASALERVADRPGRNHA